MNREATKKIRIGDITIGGPDRHPVYDEYEDGGCGSDCGTDTCA